MNLVVLGAGYVGLVSGACFAKLGHHVICVDIDKSKIESLNQGAIPIYEPGLSDLVKQGVDQHQLCFVESLKEITQPVDAYMIAVGTPSRDDGSVNVDYVMAAARNIARHLTQYAVIIDKSTVPVGTAESVHRVIAEQLAEDNRAISFDVVSNPEFLKEGDAINDFMQPDRVIVGGDSPKAFEKLGELYAPLHLGDRYLTMSAREAEMTKYVANAMLATKISFMNEIATLCDRLEADVERVKQGIALDKRIGSAFINPGCGYGGSCFPKDVKGLIAIAKENDVEPVILTAVEARNQSQKKVLLEKLLLAFNGDIAGKQIGLLGIAFKPGTDDIREASAVEFIQGALAKGAIIKAFDPVAMDAAKAKLPAEWFKPGKLTLVDSIETAIRQVDAVVIATEWPEFKKISLTWLREHMMGNVFIDGRNIVNLAEARAAGLDYFGVGRAIRRSDATNY